MANTPASPSGRDSSQDPVKQKPPTPRRTESSSRFPTQSETQATVDPTGQPSDSSQTISSPGTNDELPSFPGYEVLQLLGRGGMGEVFKARHLQLDRLVALKVIRPDRLVQPQMVERFRQEARAVARLSHPNVVAVHDAAEYQGMHYLVLEYVEGTDLAQRVRESGPLPIAEACELIRQAALGLQAAHEHGLVHRDIKPHNLILLNPSIDSSSSWSGGPRVKILDFGLARITSVSSTDDCLTAVGMAMGTLDYMAPEQAQDAHTADIRSDIYSLGCSLYHLLTGEALFPGGSFAQKIASHLQQKPPLAAARRRDVPQALQHVLDRMLAKSPDQRYQTPLEVADALAPFTQPRKPIRSDSSRRGIFAAVLLVGLLGLAAWATWALLSPPITIPTLPATAAVPIGTPPNVSPPAVPVETPPVVIPPAIPKATPPIVVPPKVAVVGEPLSNEALVRKPTLFPGVLSWSVETRQPRTRVRAIAFQPRTHLLAYTCDDGSIRLETEDASELPQLLLGAGINVDALTWSPDGERLVSADAKKGCRVWDVRRGITVALWNPAEGGSIRQLDWLPRPESLAAVHADGIVRLWEPLTGNLLATLPLSATRITCSPDGEWIAGASGQKKAWLWQRSTGKIIREITEHLEGVIEVAVSPDGRHLLAGGTDRRARVWEVASGNVLHTMGPFSALVHRAAWSPNGEYFAVGLDWRNTTRGATALVFKKDGSPHGNFPATPPQGCWDLRWSSDSAVLAVRAGNIGSPWVVQFFQPQGTPLGSAGTRWHPYATVDWNSDGSLLAWAKASMDPQQCYVELWRADHSEPIRTLILKFGLPVALRWSPSGKHLAGYLHNNSGYIWESENLKQIWELKGHEGLTAWGLAWSPDGECLATCSDDKTVRLWDTATGKGLHVLPHTRERPDVAWTPDGTELLSTEYKSEYYVWDRRTGEKRRTLPGGWTIPVFAPGGKLMAYGTAQGEPIVLVTYPEGRKVQQLNGSSVIWNNFANSTHGQMRWSPDGGKLVTPQAVWDAPTGNRLCSLTDVGSPIKQLAWAGGGRRVMAHCEDRTIRTWNAETGQLRSILLSLNPEHYVVVSAEGAFRGSPGVEEHLVMVVQTEVGQTTMTPAEFSRRYGWKNIPPAN